MQIKVFYPEIETLVLNRFHVPMQLRGMSEKKVYVGTVIPFTFFKKSIGINITVERIEGTDLFLSFDSGIGGDLLIQGAIKFLQMHESKYGKMVEMDDANQFIVHLTAIDPMKEMLKYVNLQRISIENDGVVIIAEIKDLIIPQ